MLINNDGDSACWIISLTVKVFTEDQGVPIANVLLTALYHQPLGWANYMQYTTSSSGSACIQVPCNKNGSNNIDSVRIEGIIYSNP